ncbi:Photosystem I assembly protein Ycf3 [bacterium HR15]|nr:Photosystem I assembly protein Ycf3 [bacterium HR15]
MQALPKGWTQQEYAWLQALGQARTAAERKQLLQQHRDWLQPAWVERLQATLSTEVPSEAQAWLPAAQGLRFVADTLQNDRLRAFTRFRLAILYLALYELDVAMRWVQESLALFRKIGNSEGMALSLHLQADIVGERGDLRQAIRLMQQALPLYQRTRNPERQAWGEMEMGRLYSMAGEPARALNYLQRALRFARQAKSIELQAVIWMAQGIVLRALGQFDDALQAHQQALDLFRQLNRPASVAKQIANIGLVYWSMGLTQEARWHYQQAMPLFKELNLRQDVAICLMNTSLLLQDEGDLARAIETCQEALRMSESLNDEVGIAFCEYSLADMSNAREEYAEALQHAERAIHQAQRIGLKQVFLQTQVLRAYSLHELGRYAEAERVLNDLLPHLTQSEHRVEQINALLLLGEGARRRGDWMQAQRFYQQCLQQIKHMRLPALPPEELSRAFRKVQACISQIACAYAAAHQPEHAFAVCQQGKGIGLRLATEIRRQPITGLPPAEVARLSALRQRWERAEQQWRNARIPRERLRAQRAYERALSEWSRSRLNLARRYPRYRIMQQVPVPLQELPLAPDAALIEYVQVEKMVAILVVRREGNRNRVRSSLVPVAGSKLRQTLDDLHRWIEQGGDLQPIHQAARQLYRWLVEPIARQLHGVRQVILCADGVLHRVPWTVLQMPNGRYWTEQVAITQAASASVWASTHRMGRSPISPRPSGFSSPGYPSESEKKIPLMVAISQFPNVPEDSLTRKQLAPLLSVQQERRLLSRLLGRSLQVVSESQATRARVLAALPRASQIHFATHAVTNPQLPLLSALALYGKTAPEWLYAYEMLGLSLRARLVVLSACNTAGDALTSDGLMGLAWAFLAAGCPSVVATLWKLPDEGVPLWMEAFYRALKDGLPVAKAVRQANLRLLKHPHYAHPRYWAGWTAFGKE